MLRNEKSNHERISAMALPVILRKAILLSVLFGLVLIQAALLEGILPYEWRHAIHQQSLRIFPSERYDPHPDMDWEFELDFRQHPSHRAILYAVTGILTLGNVFLYAKVLQAFRRLRSPSTTS